MNCTPKGQAIKELSERMGAMMQQVVERLGEATVGEAKRLGELEAEVLGEIKGMGQALLAGRCGLAVPAYPAQW